LCEWALPKCRGPAEWHRGD